MKIPTITLSSCCCYQFSLLSAPGRAFKNSHDFFLGEECCENKYCFTYLKTINSHFTRGKQYKELRNFCRYTNFARTLYRAQIPCYFAQFSPEQYGCVWAEKYARKMRKSHMVLFGGCVIHIFALVFPWHHRRDLPVPSSKLPLRMAIKKSTCTCVFAHSGGTFSFFFAISIILKKAPCFSYPWTHAGLVNSKTWMVWQLLDRFYLYSWLVPF